MTRRTRALAYIFHGLIAAGITVLFAVAAFTPDPQRTLFKPDCERDVNTINGTKPRACKRAPIT